MRIKQILVLVSVSFLGATYGLAADDLDSRILQKIDRDHKADVSKGVFAHQKARAKAQLAARESGGGRAIASTAGDEAGPAADHGGRSGGEVRGSISSNAKTVAERPSAIRAVVAARDKNNKGSGGSSGGSGRH